MTKQTRRALLSVSDKTGVVEFAKALAERGFELVSTGGTATALREAGLAVIKVSDVTGFPEILDGRVKTLHPKIHGGLLGDRRRQDHRDTMADHHIAGFDLLVLNLYPFGKTVESGADFDTCIENIDIGGPAMLRAAAKNHANVLPLCDPGDYSLALTVIDEGTIDQHRRGFAQKAFGHTATYDAAIAAWLGGEKTQTLRYGENPHQAASLIVRDEPARNCVAHSVQIQGKELSYNNYLDADSAWELSQDLGGTNAVIVKHNNPCGAARGGTLLEAFEAAKACDPTSAFGGVIALSQPLDLPTAQAICAMFVEVVLCPMGPEDAEVTALMATKPNVRVLHMRGGWRGPDARQKHQRTINGAVLEQDFDQRIIEGTDLQNQTQLTPNEAQVDDLLFAFTVAKHTKSNAIILAKDGHTLGIGAGQMSRVDAARIARWKAEDAGLDTSGCVVASDAFFPFADGLQVAIDAGASAVIQPGGSMRDKDVIAAADEAGLAMVFTGVRHFRH